ncbi:MAG: DNA repair protein RecN [Erysipelotrichia bacterium]|nr:DNA repair protein RecN [Erysipelotrichia bacterium]NCC55167.1 DNA repair protein RecN [Erysipelotrichia bacterium]
MIREIYVKNFILIDELHLQFANDFSCFSGETGAGKSLLIDAISILCGARCSSQYIQKGAQKAFIEATIELSENHLANQLIREAGYEIEDHTFVISREFNQEGKSVARFNQRVTTLSFIKEIMQLLVDIHSQHDNQYLLNNKFHLSLLDSYVNEKTLLKNVRELYQQYQKAEKKLQTLIHEDANPDDLEYLQFQLNEMETMNIKENEVDELEMKQKEMAAFDKISSSLSDAISTIENSRYEQLYHIQKQLDFIDDEQVSNAKEEIMNAYYSVDEQLSILKDYQSHLHFDEHTFNEIQSRLFDINKMFRKHGGSYKTYIQKQESIKEQIAFIENRQSFIDEQNKQVEEYKNAFLKESRKLSEVRKEKALNLQLEVQKELKELHLPNAVFMIRFDEKMNANGIDQVEFMISMNVGEDVKALAKVASGGELSRLMLGLKTIFNRLAKIETIIFDEIDNGVSGSVAYAIGKKMYTIAQHAQVFAVTHLAPVAVWADQHYLVVKKQDEKQTTSTISLLDKQAVIHELAMIAQGSQSEHSLLAAKELFERCQQEKN